MTRIESRKQGWHENSAQVLSFYFLRDVQTCLKISAPEFTEGVGNWRRASQANLLDVEVGFEVRCVVYLAAATRDES
jgi:hypothetical protein